MLANQEQLPLLQRSVSPSKFESQATGSPTKLSVPNRKLRNQPANRIHDIEFAAEISTSLLTQVRNLQALLAEREEELRDIKVEKSKLEIEAEGFQQRMKTLDESEHRYKDENWNLETQIHELIAAQKDASEREKKLAQALNILQAEKTATQRELDEIKVNHSRLVDEHTATVKHHDIELGTAKRNAVMAESERAAMQRKIDDLTSQNQELAKAFSAQRGRALDREPAQGMSDEDFETAADNITPEHSPPPSPVKGTPRHSMLESETLKTSLHHAQRTIQSLRTNVHREKTEKLELKRMLQDARDELEKMRGDPAASNRRSRKMDSREFKRPLRSSQLGGARSSRTDLYLDDPDWEEQVGEGSPSLSPALRSLASRGSGDLRPVPESSDQFETANETSNETSDAAFETAHERGGTETEDFHTGAEEFSDDDDAATETESPSKGASTIRRPPLLPANHPGSRMSFQSTASTSNDEEDYSFASELKTPTAATHPPQKMRLRVSRGALAARRSRQPSEEPTFQSSPASFANSSAAGTPQQPAQSLFAELGDFDGSDDESMLGAATPSRRSLRSLTPASVGRGRTASPPPDVPALPRVIMVDSGMMTEPVDIQPYPGSPESVVPFERPMSMASVIGPSVSHASTQWLGSEPRDDGLSRPISTFSYSDAGAQHDPDMSDKLDQFPSPPSSPPRFGGVPAPILPPPQSLAFSSIGVENVSPRSEPEILPPPPPALALSPISSERVEPVAEPLPVAPVADPFAFSTIQAHNLEPRAEPERPAPPPARLSYSGVQGAGVLPIAAEQTPPPPLSLSTISSQNVQPVSPAPEPKPSPPAHVYSSIQSIMSEPVEPKSPKRNAFIIPRDADAEPTSQQAEKPPRTPTGGIFGAVLGWGKGKAPSTPIIAEDETRQSPSGSPLSDTPESQRPFKELSTNSNVRPARKQPVSMSDQAAQTSLTSESIDEMLRAKAARPDFLGHQRMESLGSSMGTPATVRHRRPSQDSTGSVIRKGKGVDLAIDAEAASLRRPGSAASGRASIQNLPPLPPNHREVIEAARTGSSGGGAGTIGSMGPPLFPASAYRRPKTPNSPRAPLSPTSGLGTPTPRAHAPRTGSALGTAEVYSPSRITARSRQSSVSSFASEVDARFGLHGPMGANPGADFGANTDPRMIQAITQTMIGEYLWKYTRKAGRGEMSENRHRRYFWVHPYTRTLYWSDRDPSTAGRSELRAKSVPIEAVRVVTDDNPMPPGLHRKSLVIISPGRTVKFTCTTGQRHETWFNALSYLLLRTSNEGQNDTEEMAGNITKDDVAEFNPTYGRRGRGGARSRPPPSLSSYNSRTTRNESPALNMSMNFPTLTPTHKRGSQSRPSLGTLGRISGYFGSLRSRSVSGQERSEIYEASEVHDSAEDLRKMYEQQDRESDRLENVRACCDGTLNDNQSPFSLDMLHRLPAPPPSSLTCPHGSRY